MSNVEERLVDASTEDVKLLKNEYIYELLLEPGPYCSIKPPKEFQKLFETDFLL